MEVNSYLRADLSRDAGKLRVGGESSQVVHSFNQRASGSSALLSVLLVEGSIQSLHTGHTSLYNKCLSEKHQSSLSFSILSHVLV